MVDKALRVPKQRLLEPLVKRLGQVSPAFLTLTGLGVGLLAALIAALGYPWPALGMWLVNRLIDGLDGELARFRDTQSDFGGYLDIMADLCVYAALPIGLTLAQPSASAWFALAALLGSFYINAGSWMYLAALLEKRALGAARRGEKTSITMPTGIIEGTETVVFYTLFLALPPFFVPLFWTLAILVLVTTVQRLLWAYKTL